MGEKGWWGGGAGHQCGGPAWGLFSSARAILRRGAEPTLLPVRLAWVWPLRPAGRAGTVPCLLGPLSWRLVALPLLLVMVLAAMREVCPSPGEDGTWREQRQEGTWEEAAWTPGGAALGHGMGGPWKELLWLEDRTVKWKTLLPGFVYCRLIMVTLYKGKNHMCKWSC